MEHERWSGDDLITKVQAFEKELRAAGLSENTVNTYVGRAETFVRWLRGEYSPTGPNASSPKLVSGATTDGQVQLDELAHDLDADQISRTLADYAALTAYDASLKRLYAMTGGGTPDLSFADHRVAVIEWLRGWGCRHLRKADTAKTSAVLDEWWGKWAPRLPIESKVLTRLTSHDLASIESAYEDLRASRAATRSLRNRDVDVVFGHTAAAKTLFVLRPQACLPWDEPIRLAFGWTEGADSAYAHFVSSAASTVSELASRLGVKVEQLPARLARPHSTPGKIIDEYLWVKITRRL